MTSKTEYRNFYKNVRNSLSEDAFKNKSRIIFNNVISLNEVLNAKTVFVYLSYGREVATDNLIDFLFSENNNILVPKCNVSKETMIPVKISSMSELVSGSYGIREPLDDAQYKSKIDLAIIPGIAFDIYGNRIGHGKGYYDKFLQDEKILKLGLCYSDCLSETELPHYDNDLPMDYIITDREVLKFKP